MFIRLFRHETIPSSHKSSLIPVNGYKAFCEARKDELCKNYPGKRLIIVGDRVISAYDSVSDAYEEALKAYQPGHFMLQEVPARPEDDIVWLSPFAHARIFP
jgi:hypothetical protein